MHNSSKEIATHYSVLGLTQAASVPVIRAAYKALVLIHHPDKTVNLAAEERAAHSAVFATVQDAFDVLGNASLKAAYDAELERHGNRVDERRSTFHRSSTPRNSSHTTVKRSPSIRLTTPDGKRAIKAKVEQDLAYIREQRAKRDAEDANMDVAGLKFMHKTWTDMAVEHHEDSVLRAQCTIQAHVYQGKIAKREEEHEEWLQNMSKPRTTPCTPTEKHARAPTPSAPRKSVTASRVTTASPTPTKSRTQHAKTTPVSRLEQRAEDRKRAEAERVVQDTLRAQARTEEKARKEAVKQAHLDVKAAAVRAAKEKQKQKVEDNEKQANERIAKARAKAGAAPIGTVGASTFLDDDDAHTPKPEGEALEGGETVKPKIKKMCPQCGIEHATFIEWKRCHSQSSSRPDDSGDNSFFSVI